MGTQSWGGWAVSMLVEPFTSLDDYLAWAEHRPDEEHYEVVEGFPVMSPSPGGRHQFAVSQLLVLLNSACPRGHVVLPAPFDWMLRESPRLQIREPDLVVVTRSQAREPRLVRAPLLAVEILSPTSFERDVVAKRREYAQAGLRHYWIVDPETPQVAVYRTGDDGNLDMVTHASGDTEIALDQPFAVRLRPSDLVV